MTEKDFSAVPFESSDPAERELWQALSGLPRGEPSPGMRHEFYRRLHEASARNWAQRLGHWLGLTPAGSLVTAAACLVLGFGFAQLMERPQGDSARLATLEQNLAQIQRELILDRLEDPSASVRLRGVIDAGSVAPDDQHIALALLDRAARDQSPSVRSAAIDALGARVSNEDIGNRVMQILEGADSPIVQLALIDLILRQGNSDQLRQLQQVAERGQIHPDLVRHVNRSLRSNSI